MFNPIKHWQQKRKERDNLIKIVDAMKAEDEMVLDDLCRQVEMKLYSMPVDEALKLARNLSGEA